MRWKLLAAFLLAMVVMVPAALADEWWGTSGGDFRTASQDNNYIIHPPVDQLPQSAPNGSDDDGARLSFVINNSTSSAGTTVAYMPNQYFVSSTTPFLKFEMRGGYWNAGNNNRDRYDKLSANPGWIIDDFIKKRGKLSPIYYEVYQLQKGSPTDGKGAPYGRLLGIINPRDPNNFPTTDNGPNTNTYCKYVTNNSVTGPCWRTFEVNAPGGPAGPVTNRINLASNLQDSCYNRNNVWNVNIRDKCTQPVYFSLTDPSPDPNAKTIAKGPPDLESDLRNVLALKDTSDTTDESKPKPKQTAGELLKKYGSGVKDFFLGGTAQAFHVNNATRAITVYVNPRELSPGQVTVQISGGNCTENVKTVGGDGSVTFGGCPSAGHSYDVWVHQSRFDRGPNGGDGQPSFVCTIGDGAKLQTNVGGVVGFDYNCTRRITVWANPRGWSGGAVTVQLFGGACNDNQKVVNGEGYALFAGCPYAGHAYTAAVHESHFEKEGGAVECDIPQGNKTQGVGGDNNVNFYYNCFRNTPIATDSGMMSSGVFQQVDPGMRFSSAEYPNMNGNYVFLIKAVNYQDIGNGYVTNYGGIERKGEVFGGCLQPIEGNTVVCPQDLLTAANNRGVRGNLVQDGYFVRTPRDVAGGKSYIASTPNRLSFGVSYGPVGGQEAEPGEDHEYEEMAGRAYSGLRFQAGGSACRNDNWAHYTPDLNGGGTYSPNTVFKTGNADWDAGTWVWNGQAEGYANEFKGFEGSPPGNDVGIAAQTARLGRMSESNVLDTSGYGDSGEIRHVNYFSISGTWKGFPGWAIFMDNPPGDFPYNPTWRQDETFTGRFNVFNWNDGNLLYQGGAPFTWGFWPTCRQPGVELQTPKDGYTYDGQNSDNSVDINGDGRKDYVDGFLNFKFSYTLPETRGQVRYRVEFTGPDNVANKNTERSADNVASGVRTGEVPIQVGDLRPDTSYSWRVCVTANNWINQNCSGNWSFKVNQGPTATIVSGNAVVPNTNTQYSGTGRPNQGVYYKCSQLGSRLTDPEAAPTEVRPYYRVSWTENGQVNTVDTYTRQGTSDNNTWSNWRSGNHGYKAEGSAFTSDEVSPRLWRSGSQLRSLTAQERAMSMTEFLQNRVPDGVDINWEARGEDRFGAADLSPTLGDLLPLYNNSNPFTAGGNNAGLGFDQQAQLVNRRFGLPTPERFHKNTAPNFNTASTKRFKDLAGNVITTATDGQTVQVETRMVNGGETPTKFYELRDYLGALRDFEQPTNITLRRGNGTTITLPAEEVLSKVVPNRQNGNDTMLPEEVDPKSADYVRGSWRIDLGSNQDGPLADPAMGGAGNVLNPGDVITLTYQVRANRNQQLLVNETNNDFNRKLFPTDTHFWAYYQENYCNDADRKGVAIEKLPGTVAAPWLRGQRGSIASNGGIFGYDSLSGQSNATFLVQANGALSHFTGGAGVIPNYSSNQAICTSESGLPNTGERPGGVDWRRTMITNIGKLMDGSHHSTSETASTFNASSGQVTLNPSNGSNVWVAGSPENRTGLTITRPEAFRGVGTLVVYGDLTIGPGANMSYQADTNGVNSLGVIVIGNLNIDPSVTNVVGSFFVLDSDPTLDDEGCPVNIDATKTARGRVSTGSSANRLNIQGLVVAGAYDLLRYYINPSDSEADPAENIYYDGRVLASTPPGFGTFRNTASWQEIAP